MRVRRWRTPFHTFPPDTRAANEVRCHCFCALGSTPPRVNRGDGSGNADLRSAPLGEAQRTTNRRSAQNRGDGLGNADLRSAPLREAQRKASVRIMPNAGVPAERRTTPEVGVLPAARLRRAVPTRGRRSLACASRCRWGYPPRCVARRLRAVRASPTAQNRGDGGAPVSDRHRAGARNPHR